MSSAGHAKVSIVIRAFNEERHIGRLLAGIMRQSVPEPEIVLVDSGSTDATVAIASRYPVKVVHIAPDDFTFGRSLNLGIANTTNEIVVLASAHVYPVFEDWLEKLAEHFTDPQVALAYGRQRGTTTTTFSEHRIFQAWFPHVSNAAQQQPFCNNANCAIRRSLWVDTPYDETLTGLEDIDWCKRMLARGLRVVYDADAEVVHVHEEPPRRIFQRYRREAMALKRIFPDEQFGLLDFLRLCPSNIAKDLIEAKRQGQLLASAQEVVLFRFLQFLGTWRGFAEPVPAQSELKRRMYYPPERAPRGNGKREHSQHLAIDYAQEAISMRSKSGFHARNGNGSRSSEPLEQRPKSQP